MNWNPDQVAHTVKQLAQYKQTIHKYQQLFIADNLNDTPEQQQMEAVLQRIDQIEAKLRPSSEPTNESIKPEDACDMLDKIYPASNVVQYDDSAYKEMFQQLVKQMYSNPKCNAVEIYEKIRGKKIYFVKAASKECFYKDHLSNIKPCRFYQNEHDFICLISSPSFEVTTLYDTSGFEVAKVVAKKQLYEDPIDEGRADLIEVYSWKVKEPVDFLVTSVHIEDESKAELYRKTYSPKIERGICTNLNTNLQTVVFEDSRKAYTYSRFSRTNQPIERPTTIYITGLVDGKEQSLKHEVVLRNMQKKMEVKFTQAHSIVEKNIKVDFDFDKFILNGKVITYDPTLVSGQPILHIGAGLSKGKYTVQFADDNNQRSTSYNINKTTNNGTIKLLLDLSSLDDEDWSKNDIVTAIERGQEMVKDHLLVNILTKMLKLLESMNKSAEKNITKEIMRLSSMSKSMVDIVKALTTEEIPFVKGICGAIDLIAGNIQAVNQLIKQRETYNKRSICIQKIESMIAELNTYQFNSSGKEQDKMIQETWDYYVALTKGNVTTSIVVSDIKKTFSKCMVK